MIRTGRQRVREACAGINLCENVKRTLGICTPEAGNLEIGRQIVNSGKNYDVTRVGVQWTFLRWIDFRTQLEIQHAVFASQISRLAETEFVGACKIVSFDLRKRVRSVELEFLR